MGMNEFKKGYQPRTNFVKHEKSDLHANFHSTLYRWKKHLCQLLNVNQVYDVKQTAIVPKPSAFEVEMAIEKLKRYKSRGTDEKFQQADSSMRQDNAF